MNCEEGSSDVESSDLNRKKKWYGGLEKLGSSVREAHSSTIKAKTEVFEGPKPIIEAVKLITKHSFHTHYEIHFCHFLLRVSLLTSYQISFHGFAVRSAKWKGLAAFLGK